MYATFFEDLTWQHVKDPNIVEKISKNPILLQLYNNLTIGINVVSLDCYNTIAEYVAGLSDEDAKKVTIEDVIKNVGNYIDNSGVFI